MPSVAAPVTVGTLMLVAFLARVWLDRQIEAPWAMVDELQYAEMAKSFAAHGHYLFRGQPENVHSIYPALISPAWLVGSLHTTYTLAKVINAALMTLGAIPLYLWSRRLVPPLYAILAVVLFLALPSFVYTGEILTENAFAPAMLLAFFALALALERPTVPRQLFALACVALAIATRAQGLVLFLIVPTAMVLKFLLDAVAHGGRSRSALAREARRYWPTIAALAAVPAAYVIYKAHQNASLSTGLGIYRTVVEVHYSVRTAARWVLYHFAELGFSVGLIPLSALVLLFSLACRRRSAPSPAERAFLAVAVAGVFWVVVEVGTFASRFSLRIEERYMFNLAPVLLLALVVWLARGLPRPSGWTAVAALIPAALLLMLPYDSFFTLALFNDTFGLIPLWRLTTHLGDVNETKVLVGIGALVAGVLFAAVPKRLALWLIPVAVGSFLVISSRTVFLTVKWLSTETRNAGGLWGDPSWIDHAVGKNARVEILDTADIADPHVVWQAEFWNRSVRRVFGVTAQDPSIPDVAAPLASGGRIVPGLPAGSPDLRPRYVVGASTLDVEGTRIASAGQLALWRVRSPLRFASLASGVTPDGWTGPTASYTGYALPPGAKEVVVRMSRSGLSGLPAAHVVARLGARRQEVKVPGNGSAVLRMPIRGPFTVALSVSPTFSPSQFGSPDTRVLGVRVSFAVR